MTPQELLLRAKPYLTMLIPWETPNGYSGSWERTDLFEAISISGAGQPRTTLAALARLKRATGAIDLRAWSKGKTERDIIDAIDHAVELP